jgi:hypothetical protein
VSPVNLTELASRIERIIGDVVIIALTPEEAREICRALILADAPNIATTLRGKSS